MENHKEEEEEDAVALENTIKFLEKLCLEDESVLCARMHKDGDKYSRLLVAMGCVIDHSSGSLSKLYELVATLDLCREYDPEIYEVRHVKHEYGSDVNILHRETKEEISSIEIKTSVVKKGKKYESSWCFALPPKELRQYKETLSEEHLKPLIESVYKKQKNGRALLIARHGTECIAQYSVSGAFISLYLIKKLKEKTNIGSERCNVCDEYHRAQHLVKHGDELDKRIKDSGIPFEYKLDYFTKEEWEIIMKPVPSKCNNKMWREMTGNGGK